MNLDFKSLGFEKKKCHVFISYLTLKNVPNTKKRSIYNIGIVQNTKSK